MQWILTKLSGVPYSLSLPGQHVPRFNNSNTSGVVLIVGFFKSELSRRYYELNRKMVSKVDETEAAIQN